jgi:uncharacterized protein YegP (UPF0339 family)
MTTQTTPNKNNVFSTTITNQLNSIFMSAKKQGRYELYKAKNKEICWRFIKNGKTIYRASETYKRKRSAMRGIAIAMGSTVAEVKDLIPKPKKK